MGQQIDQFCEALRAKLTNVDRSFDGLKAKIEGRAQSAEHDVRNQLAQVQTRIEMDRAKVSAAQGKLKGWVESRKSATADRIAAWKDQRETSKLQSRADEAEAYAAAALVVALAAVDDAEQSALEAWLARQDANSALAKQAVTSAP